MDEVGWLADNATVDEHAAAADECSGFHATESACRIGKGFIQATLKGDNEPHKGSLAPRNLEGYASCIVCKQTFAGQVRLSLKDVLLPRRE